MFINYFFNLAIIPNNPTGATE
ncbi:hypothetical protein DSUL_60102 [Desulfovibrionales bacterium]